VRRELAIVSVIRSLAIPQRKSAERQLDHFVGGNEHGLRNHDAERFGRLEIDDQLKLISCATEGSSAFRL
jgi:hypothetical protein